MDPLDLLPLKDPSSLGKVQNTFNILEGMMNDFELALVAQIGLDFPHQEDSLKRTLTACVVGCMQFKMEN